jgi:hypothetical protein
VRLTASTVHQVESALGLVEHQSRSLASNHIPLGAIWAAERLL